MIKAPHTPMGCNSGRGQNLILSPCYTTNNGERIMYQFDYQAPDSIEAALAALRGNDEAKILAGRHDAVADDEAAPGAS